MRIIIVAYRVAADTGWFMLGLATWLATLGAATVTVECHLTRHSFRFPGWWWK
jgi:hypothetical protein